MKTKIIITAIAALSLSAAGDTHADQSVGGYFRKDGAYVAPYTRSSPNSYRYDNYSSQGNYNPYSGRQGYKPHEFSNPSVYDSPDYNDGWDEH